MPMDNDEIEDARAAGLALAEQMRYQADQAVKDADEEPVRFRRVLRAEMYRAAQHAAAAVLFRSIAEAKKRAGL